MKKDNQTAICRLTDPHGHRINSLHKYETIILQNLVHQRILEKLVHENVTCANEYTWVNQLKFVWEDGKEDNKVSVRKMHVGLIYGQELIGSRTPVLLENEHPSYTEIMVATKYS